MAIDGLLKSCGGMGLRPKKAVQTGIPECQTGKSGLFWQLFECVAATERCIHSHDALAALPINSRITSPFPDRSAEFTFQFIEH